jgi:pantetheine-phosphate adenylyltransferase
MLRVLYPGTFDPPTNGHLNIINRASSMFDKIDIVIANNKLKSCFFSINERFEMLSHLIADKKNICLHTWDGLIVEFAKRMGIKVILRGIRALTDFDYEFELSLINKALDGNIETIFLPTDKEYFVLRSSTIKELAMFKANISDMVPDIVEKAIREKIK